MQIINKEKRQNIRFNISTPLRYQIRGSQDFGNTVTKNISKGGASFVVDKFIRPQTRLAVDFSILSRNINSIGSVRWAGVIPHSDKYQVGLEFIGIDPKDKNYIVDYLDMRLHK